MHDAEEPLTGGNVADSVVRVGSTVRKPAVAATPAVEALLEHLTAVGFEGAPKTLGRDDQGRHVLEYIPGMIAERMAPLPEPQLRRVGRLIRDFHEAVEEFVPPDDAQWNVVIPPDRTDLVCHHDLASWNLVRNDERWVFIDWDGAGPGSRLWDLAYAIHGFLPMAPDGVPAWDAPRMRAMADGYGLDEAQRRELPALIVGHTRGMYELLRRGWLSGEQPWHRLYAEGHGGHWGPVSDYIETHRAVWTDALLA